ncbi:MAG: hypothetical protein JWP00_2756 [Chloroflexi bacterium]|nr:hypothetical protein [Chloroflexota bacterium]
MQPNNAEPNKPPVPYQGQPSGQPNQYPNYAPAAQPNPYPTNQAPVQPNPYPTNQAPVQPNGYPGNPPNNNYGNNGNWQQPYPNSPYYGQPPVKAKSGVPVWAWIVGAVAVFVVLGGILAATGVLTGSVNVSTSNTFTTSSGIRVREVTLAKGYKDESAVSPTTTFSPSDNPLHSVVKLENAPTGTTVTGAWTAVNAGGEQNVEIGSKELRLESGKNFTAHFSVELPRPWPVGSYKFELYLNDKLEKTVDFTVK